MAKLLVALNFEAPRRLYIGNRGRGQSPPGSYQVDQAGEFLRLVWDTVDTLFSWSTDAYV